LDVLLQKRPNKAAAALFFRRLLNQHCRSPRRLVTDKLRSYAAAHREMMLNKLHDTSQYANNRIELSREPTRQREHPEPDRTRKNPTFRLMSATHAIFGLAGPTLLQIHGVASDQPCQLVEKLSSRTNSNVLRQRISKVSHTSGMWRFARCRAGFETSVVTIVRLARSDSA